MIILFLFLFQFLIYVSNNFHLIFLLRVNELCFWIESNICVVIFSHCSSIRYSESYIIFKFLCCLFRISKINFFYDDELRSKFTCQTWDFTIKEKQFLFTEQIFFFTHFNYFFNKTFFISKLAETENRCV